MSIESVHQFQPEFDDLTQQMREISDAVSNAPETHQTYYNSAFEQVFESATTLLVENPTLARRYRLFGELALVNDVDDLKRSNSLFRLQRYVEDGLLPADSVPGLAEVELPYEARYTSEDYQVFNELFWEPNFVSDEDDIAEVEEETSDEENYEEEGINSLDVLEHLEHHGLDTAQLAFIRGALDTEPVVVEDLRKREWDILSLSKSEYDDFVRHLPDLRASVQSTLSEVDLVARWVETKKRGGKRGFQLLVGEEALHKYDVNKQATIKKTHGYNFEVFERESGQTRVKKSDEEIAQSEEARQLTNEMNFASKLLDGIKEIMENEDVRLSLVMRRVADSLNITSLEARQLISGFVATEQLFYDSQKGSRLLSVTDRGYQRRRSNGKNGNGESRSAKELEYTSEDVTAIGLMFNHLTPIHIDRGDTIAALVRVCDGTVDEKRARNIVRQLEREQIFKTDADRAYRRGRKGLIVMFTSRQIYDRWLEEPQALMQDVITSNKKPNNIVD